MKAADGSVLKIVFMSSLIRYGGGERWMLDAAERLQDRGHDVRLVSRPRSVLAERAPSARIANVPIEMRGDFDPVAISSLRALLRRFRPDVVCPNLDREIRIAATAIKFSQLRGPHAPRLIPRRGSEFPLKDKLIYRLVYGRAVDRVIVNSHATLRTMLSRTPWFSREKAVVIHNGIDTSVYDELSRGRDELRAALRQDLGISASARVIVLVGELNERKGQQYIIDAVPQIVARHSDAHFLFVGEGDARSRLESAILDSGAADHMTLAGFRTDIPDILLASDILLLPSRVEGFGYVLAEAMAARLPVVASDASSIPEIVEDGATGFLHPVGDTSAIASAIGRLLDDPAAAATMGERGYARVKARFDIERMIDEVEGLFRSA